MGFIDQLWKGAASVLKAPFGIQLHSLFSPSRGAAAMAGLLHGGGSAGFPGAWTSDRIEQSRHYKAWTYIAIKAIAEEIACNSPSVAAVRTRAEAKQKGLGLLCDLERRKTLASIQSHEELEPVDSSHPLCQLLANPNEPDVAFSFWYETAMWLELNGNSYWWVINNQLGLPAELWVLPASWVWPISGNGKIVDHYDVRPYGAPGSYRALEIPSDKIIHFSYKNPLSKIDGLSPLQAAAEWIDTGESIDATRWHSFKNGIWPGMVLSLDPEIQDPDTGMIDEIYARLDARMRGEGKYDRPLILPSGVKADSLTRSPKEMDFQRSGDQVKDWIMAVHRVGKSIAGITEEVNYASMVAATANFMTRTIRPKLSYIGQVATEKLARRFDDKLVIYWKDLAPDDPAQKTADLNADYNMNALTENEVRAARGRAPREGGDKVRSEASQAQQGQGSAAGNGSPAGPGQGSQADAMGGKLSSGAGKKPVGPGKSPPGSPREQATSPTRDPRKESSPFDGLFNKPAEGKRQAKHLPARSKSGRIIDSEDFSIGTMPDWNDF